MNVLPKSRIKRLSLALVGTGVVIGLCSGWIVWIFLDLEGAREQIAAELGQKLHRRIKIERLSVGFFRATMRNVVIMDRVGFRDEPFAAIQRASAYVQPWELLQGRLGVSHLTATRPLIVLKRNAAGELNVGDLLNIDRPHPGPVALPSNANDRAAPPSPAAGRPHPDTPRGNKPSPKITTVDVTTISLNRATLKYVDLPTSAATILGEFDVRCQGSLGTDPILIHQGFLRFHTLNLQVQANVSRDLKTGHFAIQVADLDLMSFKPYLSFLSGFARGYWMLRNLSLRGRINSSIVDIDELSCRPNGGSLKGAAKLWLSQGKPTFILDATFEEVGLDTFLWHTRPDGVSFAGALTGTCSVTGRGTSLDDLKAQLIGNADVQVTEGRFQNKALMQIGRIATEYLGARDFDVYRATALGRFFISEGKINSSDLRFDSNIFDLYMTGPGCVTFDGELSVPKVTLRVGQGKDAAQIPLKIKGYVNEPRVDADWKGLGKSLIAP